MILESEVTTADSPNALILPIWPQQQPNSVCEPLRLQLGKRRHHIYTSTQHKHLRVEELVILPALSTELPHALTITVQSSSSSPVMNISPAIYMQSSKHRTINTKGAKQHCVSLTTQCTQCVWRTIDFNFIVLLRDVWHCNTEKLISWHSTIHWIYYFFDISNPRKR